MGLQTILFAQSNLSSNSSQQPLKYRIAFIDPRFQITKEQFIEVSQQAAEIWQKETGKTYFIYDSQAQLSINLIYDDHQIIKDEQQNNLDALLQKQEAWRIKNEEIILNKQEVAQLSTDLNKKKISLRAEFEQYQQDVIRFNQREHQYAHADNLTNIQPFHKGLFSQNQIQIYGYASLNDLRLTLAHELGHALGLKHTTDPKSLMYPYLKEQDIRNFKLTDSDLDLLGSIYRSN